MSYANLPMIWKVVSLLLLLGAISIGGAFYATMGMSSLDTMYTEIIEGPQVAALQLAQANRGQSMIAVAIYGNIVAATDDANKAAMTARLEAEKFVSDRIEAAKKAAPKYNESITAIQAKLQSAVSGACAETLRIANESTDAEGNVRAAKLMDAGCRPALDQVLQASTAVSRTIVEDVRKMNEAGTAATLHTKILVLGSIGAATALVIALAIFLVRSGIVAPIKAMMEIMTAMGKGDLSRKVTGTGRADEIGAMSTTLEVLQGQLREAEQLREAQAKREAVERELLTKRETLAQAFVARMKELAASFAQSSGEVAHSARDLSSTAEECSRQAQAVAAAAEQAATNVQTVAASSEELAASVREITSQVSHSADVADIAFKEAESSNARIGDLSTAATAIGDVISLIEGIASQTNLLALNATIEAARAGEAGRGFAVVASEVKELAAQTAKATADISDKVREIQHATTGTVTSMAEIVRVVTNIKQISSTIASAVEEQGAATGEIAQNCQQAATGTQQVTENIEGVGRAAEMTGAASTQLLTLSEGLSGQAADLRTVVESFVRDLNAA